jgi:hypothetical protein
VGQHDLSYRLFFAHRRMIQDLLREIVGKQWVVDEATYPREDLAAMHSPVADLFSIERSRDWFEVRSIIHQLRQHLLPTEISLRRAFETYLQTVILPRFGLSQEEISDTLTLEELETMLAESIDRWNREIREEGRQEGEARLVLRQLRFKFGPLEADLEERVRTADTELLLEWGERVLTARSLQDVFQG